MPGKKGKASAKAKTDISMFNSGGQNGMRDILKQNGWTETQLQRDNSKDLINEPFLIFQREILIPNLAAAWRKRAFSPRSQNSSIAQSPTATSVQTMLALPGAKPTMGVPSTEMLPPPPTAGGTFPVGSVASQVAPVSSLSDITTVQRMRSNEDSFVIGFDTEFYYDDFGVRHVLSWQFAFIQPEKPDFVQEILVFGGDEDRTLPFSYILNYIIENFGIYASLGKNNSDNKGFSYHMTHRWRVPVKDKNGIVKPKEFRRFEDAVIECSDPIISSVLFKTGKWRKAEVEYIETPAGTEVHYSQEINGYPIGYLNVYTEADKHAVPVILICHTGSADITTLDSEDFYEKDMMLRLSQIQGGLVTLKPYYMHNPVLSRHRYFYPVQVCVRDSMGFAPSKKKSLKSLGDTIGVPKLEVPYPFSKDDMLGYMVNDTLGFVEYAINDSVIALLYSAELWGYNKSMPVTVSSAAGRAAVPIIKEYFGLDEKDDAGFNLKYRGLHKVKKGIVPLGNGMGFLDNTALEPLDVNCELLQMFAKNSYKGGYNGSSRIGYYPEWTNDFDLANAYLTCMSLVPDVDWENCIAFESTNINLTLQHVRSPFEPVFAYIDFEFPDDVRFPCIPVTVEGSMIFPRSNRGYASVYASAPELYLALLLGAKITAKRYIAGSILLDDSMRPSHSLYAVVKQFVTDRDLAKVSFGKNSLADLLLKESGSSIYGKTAQDVIDKSSWSASKELMVDIGGSPITSPVHACLTTAGVRCVLLSAMNQLEDLGYKVYSVTTDGFITDADLHTLENLDLYGFTKLFQSARAALVGDPTMWTIKHRQNDLVNLTTRGNASLIVEDKNNGTLGGVMAHNSFVTGEIPDSYEDRYSFITQVLSRTGRLKTVNDSFAKFKDMARRNNRIDFSVHKQERMISMDFDLKRKPVEISLVDVSVTIDSNTYHIGNFETEPYDTIDEYEFYKKTGKSVDVLRSYEDWIMFFDKISGKLNGRHRVVRDMDWSILFSAVMAYRLKVPLDGLNGDCAAIAYLDSSEYSVEEKVAWINGFNHSKKKFTVNTWKDCRKSNRAAQMLPEVLYIDLLKDMISLG